jgi:hypothetical protein
MTPYHFNTPIHPIYPPLELSLGDAKSTNRSIESLFNHSRYCSLDGNRTTPIMSVALVSAFGCESECAAGGSWSVVQAGGNTRHAGSASLMQTLSTARCWKKETVLSASQSADIRNCRGKHSACWFSLAHAVALYSSLLEERNSSQGESTSRHRRGTGTHTGRCTEMIVRRKEGFLGQANHQPSLRHPHFDLP